MIIYIITYNKINWNTLTKSYNCFYYLCEGRLSINYDYLDETHESLTISKINETKKHSILKEDHCYIIKSDVKELFENISSILIKKRCSNPLFLKHYLIYYCIKKNKLNITGKILSNLFKDI